MSTISYIELIFAYHTLFCNWGMQGNDGFTISKSLGEIEGRHEELLNEAQLAAAAEEKEAHSFEVDPAQVTQSSFCN